MNNPNNKTEYKSVTFNGELLEFNNRTVFMVQLGKDSSSYKTKWTFTGDFANALFYYKSLNIGRGYKKRLFAPSLHKKILARSFS